MCCTWPGEEAKCCTRPGEEARWCCRWNEEVSEEMEEVPSVCGLGQ